MTPAIELLAETLGKAKKKKFVEGKGAWQHAKDEAKKRGKPDSYAAAIAAKICHKSAALDVLRDTLAKSGGEGSRGGHVIGRTSNGHAIYSSGQHVPGYHKKDLIEAASHHDARAKDYGKRSEKASGEHKKALRDMQRVEENKADTHRKRAGVWRNQ